MINATSQNDCHTLISKLCLYIFIPFATQNLLHSVYYIFVPEYIVDLLECPKHKKKLVY